MVLVEGLYTLTCESESCESGHPRQPGYHRPQGLYGDPTGGEYPDWPGCAGRLRGNGMQDVRLSDSRRSGKQGQRLSLLSVMRRCHGGSFGALLR